MALCVNHSKEFNVKCLKENSGAVIESLGARKGEMLDMMTTDNGLVLSLWYQHVV